MNWKVLAMAIIVGSTSLMVCACRKVEQQQIVDVSRPQQLVFNAPMEKPMGVDIHVSGYLDGSATLTSVEIFEPQKAQWPTSPLSGEVDCSIHQVWSERTCTLNYAPVNVHAGNLSVTLSWR